MATKKPFTLPVPYRAPRTKLEERQFGTTHGARSARENITQYGCAFAEHNARQLERHAKSRGADTYDRAYAKAFRAAVESAKKCRTSKP